MNKLRRDYGIVFRKEFRELLRDRRSLFWLFAPPIILPGLALCAAIFIGAQAVRFAQDGIPVAIENGTDAFIAYFEDADETYVVEPTGDDRFGTAAIVVEVPPDFQARIDNGQTADVRLITKDGSLVTFFAKSAVRTVIQSYNDDIRDQRLAALGLEEQWLTPISIDEDRASTTSVGSNGDDTDDEDESGSNIVATIFLPLAVTSWLLGGGMGLILDTTVGEKERQTIENLLVTPANRIGVVLGKMTVVFIASMVVMSLWLVEGLLLNGASNATADLAQADTSSFFKILLDSSSDALGLVLALVVMIVPFTVMLNGLVMAWCAFAANYREANLFMALIQLGLPATVLLTIFSFPPDLTTSVYGIPILGTIVGIRDLFSNSLSTTELLVNLVSTTAYAIFSVWLAAWVFNREWSLTRGLQ